MSNTGQPLRVFICYASKDNDPGTNGRGWRDSLLEHLKPLEDRGLIRLFWDAGIPLGEEWSLSIGTELRECDVAVLLLSPSLLASNYIRTKELPVLIERRKNRQIQLLPIVVRPFAGPGTRVKYPDPDSGPHEFDLTSLQSAGSRSRTLVDMNLGEQDRELARVAEALGKLAKPSLTKPNVPTQQSAGSPSPSVVEIGLDAQARELARRAEEMEGSAVPSPTRANVPTPGARRFAWFSWLPLVLVVGLVSTGLYRGWFRTGIGPTSSVPATHATNTNPSYASQPVSTSNAVPNAVNSPFFNEIGRPSPGDAIGNAVEADALGNVVVVGTIKGVVSFGSIAKVSQGGIDLFVAKYGPSGNLLWVRTVGGNSDVIGAAVAVDASGNIFVTGYFYGTADFGGGPLTSADGIYGSDIFVAKYSSSGEHLWSERFGGRFGNNLGAGIAVDGSGNAFVGGKIYAEGDLGNGVIATRAGSADGFVLKLSSQTGAYLWARDFGSTDSDVVRALAVDSLGDVVVVGYAFGGIDFGSGLVINAGSADLFIVKYAGVDGHYLWSRAAGGLGPDTAEGVAVDTNQNVFVTGGFTTALNLGGVSLTASVDTGMGIYVAKYNTSGVLQWARGISHETTGGGISAKGATVDSVGNVTITGKASGGVIFGDGFRTDGDSNIFVAKYRFDGLYLWAKRSSNSGRCGGLSVATDNDRNVWTTGFIQGEVSVDSLTASSPGMTTKSVFLLKIPR